MDKGDAFAKLLRGVEVAFNEKGKDDLFEPFKFPEQMPTFNELKYQEFFLKFMG